MQYFVGTSGFSYKAWKGSFYPDKLADGDMLEYYAGQLSAVEINNTFYRLPKAEMLAGWAARVADGFRFAIKASRRITHQLRLQDCEEPLAYLMDSVAALGPRLGLVFFQLPPYLRCDIDRLQRFIELIPTTVPAAFEFRHPSWLEAPVFELLSARNMALVNVDDDDHPLTELQTTADWGYVRLRGSDYQAAHLAEWRTRLDACGWQRAYVFFKHEDAGTGPRWAKQFKALS